MLTDTIELACSHKYLSKDQLLIETKETKYNKEYLFLNQQRRRILVQRHKILLTTVQSELRYGKHLDLTKKVYINSPQAT